MEIAIGQLIKILLGVAVLVIVVVAVAIFFKEKFLGFFDSFIPSDIIMGLFR